MTDKRTHPEQIYITGSRQDAKGKSYLLMACSRCSDADLVTRGITAAHVIAAVEDHIKRTEGGFMHPMPDQDADDQVGAEMTSVVESGP